MKRNVAVVYASDYAEMLGGIRTYIEELGRSAPDNIDLTYVGLNGKQDTKLPRPTDKFIDLKARPIFGILNLAFISKMFSFDFSKFDRVVCHRAEMALFIRVWHRKSLVLILHGGTFNASRTRRKLFGFLYPLIEIFACATADLVYCVNPSETWFLTRKIADVRQAPLVFSTAFICEESNVSSFNFFLIGRLVDEKRFDLALKLLEEVQHSLPYSIQVFVIGSGPSESHLKRQAEHLKLNTKFIGQIPGSELAEFLKKNGGNLLITSKFEGFPLVAIEARMAGLNVYVLRTKHSTFKQGSLGIFESHTYLGLKNLIVHNLLNNMVLPETKTFRSEQEMAVAQFWSHC